MSSLELVMMRRINELNEEVRRLNEDVKRLAADSIKDMSHITELTDELERLRAYCKDVTLLKAELDQLRFENKRMKKGLQP